MTPVVRQQILRAVRQVATVQMVYSVIEQRYVFHDRVVHELHRVEVPSSVASRPKVVLCDEVRVSQVVTVAMAISVTEQRSVQIEHVKQRLVLVGHFSVMSQMIRVDERELHQIPHQQREPSLGSPLVSMLTLVVLSSEMR